MPAGEKRRARCWVLRDRGRRAIGSTEPLDLDVFLQQEMHAGYRPYFENYTVDASILDSDDAQSGACSWLCRLRITIK